MIHPLQYELETARHVEGQRQAAQRRMVTEAEKSVSGDMPSAPFLGSILGYLHWRVIDATFVRGGVA